MKNKHPENAMQDASPLPMTLVKERDQITAQLSAAGLLSEDWTELDAEIAALEAQGVISLTEPIRLAPGTPPSETLIDEDRGAY